MAVFEGISTLSVEAGEDLSSDQYKFVKLSAGKVIKAGDGGDAIGVLLNAPTSGLVATVATVDGGGKCKVKLGGTVAIDAYVGSGSGSTGVTGDTGAVILGQALEAGVTGDVITVLLGHRGITFELYNNL